MATKLDDFRVYRAKMNERIAAIVIAYLPGTEGGYIKNFGGLFISLTFGGLF